MPISPAPAAELRPFDLESEIGCLLDELSSVQTELLAVLAEKRAALGAPDMPRLAALEPREAELMGRLAQCQQRRSELLAAANDQGQPGENLRKLVSHRRGGKPSPLENRVKEAAARTRLLQHQSLANWVLAQRSLLHVSQLLEIIATGGRMQPTYGDKESLHARGSLVNQEA